jgi:large subunit ribosomal protein L33
VASTKQTRSAITLACTVCKARNYKTTKKRGTEPLEIKKFCSRCGTHTLHREQK